MTHRRGWKKFLYRALPAGALVMFALVSLGCGPDSDQELRAIGQAVILGDDNRTPLTESDLGSMVGSFRLPDGKMLCTGFFSGVKEVTTARHCLGGNSNTEGYHFITADHQDYWVLGTKATNKAGDIVQLRVERSSFGATDDQSQKYLTMGPVVQGKEAIIISFDPAREEFLVVAGKAPTTFRGLIGILGHDLDTIPGASGSPIIQGDKVVGIHLGFFTDKMTDQQRAALGQTPQCVNPASDTDCKIVGPKVISNIAVGLADQKLANLSALEANGDMNLEWYGCGGYGYGARYYYPYYSRAAYYYDRGYDYARVYNYARYWGPYSGYGYSYGTPYGPYYGRYYPTAYNYYNSYPSNRYYW